MQEYTYVYNGGTLMQMVIETTVDDGTPVTETLSFSYDASGMPMSVVYNGTAYFYTVNLQGDVMAIVDGTGNAVVSYSYDAWGNILSVTGTIADTLGQSNPLRYRGYVYDQETELYYLQSRYYDPNLGRFINADALVSTGQGILGNNMFAYCQNNPVNYSDPTGELTQAQIHNSVLAAIILSYMQVGYYSLSAEDTMIYYNGTNIWNGWGFCDLYDCQTGEVWELKKDSLSYSCTTKQAKKQLGKYVNGRLAINTELMLSRGGDLVFGQHTYCINDLNGTYTITYWQECQGILRYSYTFERDNRNNVEAEQRARLGCITVAAAIVTLGLCFAGAPAATTAVISTVAAMAA